MRSWKRWPVLVEPEVEQVLIMAHAAEEVIPGLNQAQVQALVGAITTAMGGRGGRKVSSYTEATPSSWLVWKKHFRTVAEINEWGDLRQRREAAAAMEGQAGRLVRDIEVNPAAGGRNIDQLLTLYENQFMPASESDLAIAAFEAASQSPEETPILWAARCRELFQRAYPAGGLDDRALINRFTVGLADREVALYVHEDAPATYNAASEAAQRKTASKQFIQAQWKNTGVGRKGFHSIGIEGSNGGQEVAKKRNNPNIVCHFCKGRGHIQRNCPEYKQSQEWVKKKKAGSKAPAKKPKAKDVAAVSKKEETDEESEEEGN